MVEIKVEQGEKKDKYKCQTKLNGNFLQISAEFCAGLDELISELGAKNE